MNIDIPGEKGGFIPNVKFYNKIYGKKRWKTSNIRSLDIGQGEMLVTPLQMANLAAIIANRGFYYTPHLVKKIGNKSTEPYSFYKKRAILKSISPFLLKNEVDFIRPSKIILKKNVNINKQHFEFLINAMEDVTKGTAKRAYVKDIKICCKTGTVENPHGKDHSVFIAFAPRENPVIAISVYVENAGWGGIVAASIASLIIEKYIKGKISGYRKNIESFYMEPPQQEQN